MHTVTNKRYNEDDRIFWLDFARCFAIFTVVLIHATEKIYAMNVSFFESLSMCERLFAHTTFTLGRLGVPIFLFLTGYLLLGKYNCVQDRQLFWRRKWFVLIVTTEIWILIYNVFLIFYRSAFSFRWIDLLKEFLFLRPVPMMAHMWYMPPIIGTYLFIPVFPVVIRIFKSNILKFPLFITGSYFIFAQTIKLMFDGGRCFQHLN